MENKQAERIQTSILNAAEKKALVWLAERQPKWVTSDFLTFIGFLGAVIIAVGYGLSGISINFLWLASFGFLVNWYGDSMDGTLARVRHQQRPKYGFFIDHNIDCINEAIMFIGAGLSPLLNLNIAFLVLTAYLILSISVYINTHLKNEFRLTYGKMGPTELRIIIVIVNTLFIFFAPLREFAWHLSIGSWSLTLSLLDIIALVIFALLMLFYFISLVRDGKQYAAMEPLKKDE